MGFGADGSPDGYAAVDKRGIWTEAVGWGASGVGGPAEVSTSAGVLGGSAAQAHRASPTPTPKSIRAFTIRLSDAPIGSKRAAEDNYIKLFKRGSSILNYRFHLRGGEYVSNEAMQLACNCVSVIGPHSIASRFLRKAGLLRNNSVYNLLSRTFAAAL